jgi:hypothetical protein
MELSKYPVSGESYQRRVQHWLMACFSMEVCRDGAERNHRFLEEALELVQSLGCTASEAHQLVDYVYGRPDGDVNQEMGGVMVTLAALASCHDIDMAAAGETELARVWTKIDAIRAKQAAKPKHSPLPAAPALAAIQARSQPVSNREALAEHLHDRFARYEGDDWPEWSNIPEGRKDVWRRYADDAIAALSSTERRDG